MSLAAKQEQPVVLIVDDDESLQNSLSSLLRSIGMKVETLTSPAEFSTAKIPDSPCCMLLDVRMPGTSGLDFQRQLEAIGVHIPIIFMTGYGDIPMTVKAMKAGAIEFLTKPCRTQDILDAVQVAIQRSREQRDRDKSIAKLDSAFRLLTPREKEVLAFVVSGRMNKQIAADLRISEITVKVHRGNVMKNGRTVVGGAGQDGGRPRSSYFLGF